MSYVRGELRGDPLIESQLLRGLPAAARSIFKSGARSIYIAHRARNGVYCRKRNYNVGSAVRYGVKSSEDMSHSFKIEFRA